MIFVGDIALPYKESIKLKNLPFSFNSKQWFGNLEGALIDNSKENINGRALFNDKNAIKHLCSQFNFAGFALANNHIFDTGSLEETVSYLNKINVPYCGIGSSLDEANEPLIIYENDKEIVILNFGWEVIQCEVTLGNEIGVNPLRKKHVIDSVKRAVEKHPNAIIIPFMHWSYELESAPQPFERELARELIDIGVSGVIGAHPHRIGGFEVFKGKPIMYSLGNWMFKQNYYRNGKSRFPDFCNLEVAFEWDFKENEILFHFFNYDKKSSSLAFSHSENIDSETMKTHTSFKDLSNDDYIEWYKRNHYHKNKGLPIYYWHDSYLKTNIKNKINKLRDALIRIIMIVIKRFDI
jgi:hypothetical protein